MPDQHSSMTQEAIRAGLAAAAGDEMNQDVDDRTLWTAWCDYSATGEGRSIMACVDYASTEQEMRARFAEKFNDWFAKGCEVGKGVVRNEITSFLWSEAVLTAMEDLGKRRSWVGANAWFHFNLS